MATNKVIVNDEIKIDLTEDTVTPETLFEGVTAHDKSGNIIGGTFTIDEELDSQDNLIAEITEALAGKAASTGGIELTIEGGTIQPASPKDNTIWVNTDVDLGLTYLAPNAPSNPQVGDVWVNTTNKYNSNGTNASTNLIRVNDNPYLEINVLNISQWDGSAWVTRDGSAIYANGTWTNMALYLFNYGTRNEQYTFEAKHSYAPAAWDSAKSISIGYSDCMTVSNAYDSGWEQNDYTVFLTSTPIDITNFNTLKFTAKITNTRLTHRVGLYSSKPVVGGNNDNPWPSPYVSVSSTSVTDLVLDLSTTTGTRYIGGKLGSPTNSGTLYIYMICLTA